MRVGLVTKWFNRGQPVVARQLRSGLDELGHETFILARPKKEVGPRKGALDRDDVWDQPRVTESASFEVTGEEYRRWADDNQLEAVLCDQNYQFEELAALRADGIRVVGRFVWEHFGAEHVEGARQAYDVVYSMTRCEQERYRGFGMETPYVPYGCHPDLIAIGNEASTNRQQAAGEPVRFVFPGGFLGHRKPLEPVLEAFRKTSDPSLRLLIRAQVERKHVKVAVKAARKDERIELLVEDLPTDEHLRTIASCDVCVSPARWEGLGLPLFEATAFGMPAVTNDVPPMNEAIQDGVNGLLVTSHPDGQARSGISAYSPDIGALAEAMERLADPELRETLSQGARQRRVEERAWVHTMTALNKVLIGEIDEMREIDAKRQSRDEESPSDPNRQPSTP